MNNNSCSSFFNNQNAQITNNFINLKISEIENGQDSIVYFLKYELNDKFIL